MVTFTGDTFSNTERVVTGCWSLDKALADFQNNYGFPLRSVVEVYGPKGVGKTTWCLSMMGLAAKQTKKNIVILDWEGQSRETIEAALSYSGFYGNVEYVTSKDEASEETVERFLLSLRNEDQNVGLLDSIGGFVPTAYLEGEIGDSSMGVFARETGRMVGKINLILRRSESAGIVFMTNHEHPKIGSFVGGSDTAGGVRKKYLSHVRIQLSRYFGNKSSRVSGFVSFGGGWLLKGRTDDNRYGFSKREFVVWMMGGEGIHVGMTALFDCVLLGIAKLSAKAVKESNTVSLDGKTYGKLGRILESRNEDAEFFVPFQNALRETESEFVDDESEEE